MSRSFVETILFASVAINAALLLFISGVLQKMMNAVNEAAFKNLIELMVRFSSRSPFMIIVLNMPFIVAIPYYYFYGFGNRWITAGLTVWLVAGSTAKIIKLPVYKAIAGLKAEDAAQLQLQRLKFNKGNIFQAILYTTATILTAFGLH